MIWIVSIWGRIIIVLVKFEILARVIIIERFFRVIIVVAVAASRSRQDNYTRDQKNIQLAHCFNYI